MSNPVGTGPVHAHQVGALVEDRARGQSRLPRLRLGLQGRQRSRGPAHRRGDERQEDAAGRPRRDQHHRGGPGAAARLPERRDRPDEHGRAARAERARRRRSSSPNSRARGVRLSRFVDPEITYTTGTCRIRSSAASRRRRSRCAARWRWRTTSTRRSRSCATARRSRRSIPIPPGVVGHDPDYRAEHQVRSRRRQRAARQVRLQEGRRRLAHASRRQAAADPLLSRPDSLGRQQDEMWKKAYDSIGIRMEVQKDKFPELLKLEKECKLMMRTASWIADYPDADNFMQLLTARTSTRTTMPARRFPNTTSSTSRALRMPDSPERDKLYHEMTRDHRDLCAVAARHQPLSQHAGAAAGAGLQEAPDPALGMAVHRRRRQQKRN